MSKREVKKTLKNRPTKLTEKLMGIKKQKIAISFHVVGDTYLNVVRIQIILKQLLSLFQFNFFYCNGCGFLNKKMNLFFECNNH